MPRQLDNSLKLLAVISAAAFLSACGAASGIPVIGGLFSSPDGERVERLDLSAQAEQDYSAQYASDPSNKAFAVSPSGAYGVAFGAPNRGEAERAALEKCAADLSRGDLECTLYDVNGRLAYDLPVRLRRVE